MATGLRAHNEWANRPADECFPSIDSAIEYLEDRTARSRELQVNFRDIARQGGFRADTSGEVLMALPTGQEFGFSNYGFQATGKLAGAHPEFLGKLQPTTAAAALTDLFSNEVHVPVANAADAAEETGTLGKDRKILTLRDTGGSLEKVRAVNGTGYGRIWDLKAARWIKSIMANHGFRLAPESYRDEARGIYAGDRSSFFFVVDESKDLEVKRPGGQMERLSRGIMVWNSEVGIRKFGMSLFLYQYICGNHMVWGMESERVLETRHVGEALDRAEGEIIPQVTELLNEGTEEQVAVISKAMATRFATDGREAVRALRKDPWKISKSVAMEAVERALLDPSNEGLDPLSIMAIGNGLSSQARDLSYADARNTLELKSSRFIQQVAA